jgi:hypothetical protein
MRVIELVYHRAVPLKLGDSVPSGVIDDEGTIHRFRGAGVVTEIESRHCENQVVSLVGVKIFAPVY